MKIISGFVILILASLSPALAHWGDASEHGFVMGMIHPMSGLDHVLAMVTIGLWSGLVGGSARWVWPLTFVIIAGLSALFGLAGYQISNLEPIIALTVIGLGAFVTFRLKLPLVTGMVLSGGAAFVHGYVHGLELAATQNVTGFLVGFLLATSILHVIGIVLSRQLNGNVERVLGGMIALYGTLILWMAV